MSDSPKKMDDIVALCRRRGFIFQSSEIYGGINGFWDYGPLGTALKRNLKNAWWGDVVERELLGPDGQPVDIVGVDCTIIMNPKTWVASGHVGGFNDPMVDCRESKQRYRADHLAVLGRMAGDARLWAFIEGDDDARTRATKALCKYERIDAPGPEHVLRPFTSISADERARCIGPAASEPGSLTEPRQFNLMFKTHCGALQDDDSLAYLRPETAQGIFANFWNVVDTSRVKIPFGIAQVGKAFRNEVTPRNFTFRSREFEQMEIEFFIHPSSAVEWYRWWRDWRFGWWQSIGLTSANLQLREHDRDELAHYAKNGAGTSDIEYRFPFTAPGYGELEGVAHRADFDLTQHANHCGKGEKMRYFDQARNERYFPHVVEPSAGADRGTLALLCEAYTPDPSRPSGVVMRFHPRMAPIKAAVYPLTAKDGQPEIAERLYRELRRKHTIEFDEKQSIGKRYARMDEAGTPYCFTIDGETASTGSVTVRHRDTLQQERVAIDQVPTWLDERLGTA
jgi:glycyl-tRNA synthetase